MSRIMEWIARLILGGNKPVNYNFPKTLLEFGYTFNSDGKLCKIDPNTGETTDKGYEFEVKKDDRRYNQKHYEAIGDIITDYVYNMLEEMRLIKLPIPRNFNDREPYTFIFATPNALAQDKPLLVLVHGSGAVRAGQWARSLIINDNLSTGTQVPYIKKAMELGYGVLVLNTNENIQQNGRKTLQIRGSKSPEEHLSYVWDTYIKPSKVTKVAIVAHSYGGICTVCLAWERLPELKDRVFAVCMTDSIHFGAATICAQEEAANLYLRAIGRNWRASAEPLDTPIPQETDKKEMRSVSAGHTKHEMTSASAMDSVFAFIEERRLNGPMVDKPDVQMPSGVPQEKVEPDQQEDKVAAAPDSPKSPVSEQPDQVEAKTDGITVQDLLSHEEL